MKTKDKMPQKSSKVDFSKADSYETLCKSNRELTDKLSNVESNLQRVINLNLPMVVTENLNKIVDQLKHFLGILQHTLEFCEKPSSVPLDSTILNPDLVITSTLKRPARHSTNGLDETLPLNSTKKQNSNPAGSSCISHDTQNLQQIPDCSISLERLPPYLGFFKPSPGELEPPTDENLTSKKDNKSSGSESDTGSSDSVHVQFKKPRMDTPRFRFQEKNVRRANRHNSSVLESTPQRNQRSSRLVSEVSPNKRACTQTSKLYVEMVESESDEDSVDVIPVAHTLDPESKSGESATVTKQSVKRKLPFQASKTVNVVDKSSRRDQKNSNSLAQNSEDSKKRSNDPMMNRRNFSKLLESDSSSSDDESEVEKGVSSTGLTRNRPQTGKTMFKGISKKKTDDEVNSDASSNDVNSKLPKQTRAAKNVENLKPKTKKSSKRTCTQTSKLYVEIPESESDDDSTDSESKSSDGEAKEDSEALQKGSKRSKANNKTVPDGSANGSNLNTQRETKSRSSSLAAKHKNSKMSSKRTCTQTSKTYVEGPGSESEDIGDDSSWDSESKSSADGEAEKESETHKKDSKQSNKTVSDSSASDEANKESETLKKSSKDSNKTVPDSSTSGSGFKSQRETNLRSSALAAKKNSLKSLTMTRLSRRR